ncbi:MAG: tetratricopeptide repeat protein [Kordiimonadaceae bacterium]|nr:tetratricopeptide repeat protein [Kordiimonadaceae bacterium]
MNRAEKRRQKKIALKATRKSQNKINFLSQPTLSMAMQHHTSGRLSDAEKLYKLILKADPNHSETLYLLGTIGLQTGKFQKAVEFISKAIEVNPNISEYYSNLGLAQQELKKFDDAITSYDIAISLNPDYAKAFSNKGTVLKELGKLHEAIASYDKAISIIPDYAEAYFNRGIVLKELGRIEEALESYEEAISINPNIAEFYSNRGIALLELKKTYEAVVSYDKSISIKPDYAEAYFNRGIALKELGDLEAAIASYDKAVKIKPDYAQAHNNLGNIIKEKGNFEDAILNYRKALLLKPDFIDAQLNLSKSLAEKGELKEAELSIRKVLSLYPEHAEAYQILAKLKIFTEIDEDIKSMASIFAKSDLRDQERIYMGFALGKAYEDLKQYELSFEKYSVANYLQRQSKEYSIEKKRVNFKNIKQTFNPSFMKSFENEGYYEKTPIFILGMPRSGTSLVEQILDSHPEIYGAGEIDLFYNLAMSEFYKNPDLIKTINKKDVNASVYNDIGNKYCEKLKKLAPNSRFITDKQPFNFLHIGLIRLSLPNAKIIHCKRRPEDCCLSLFKTYFPADVMGFSYNLKDLGEYHTLYQELMDHWHKVIPGQIFEINYEDLITEQEVSTRRLLDYCGVDWNDRCLEFHNSGRPVKTASVVQVRQPINNLSVQKWKHYEKFLKQLLEALNPNFENFQNNFSTIENSGIGKNNNPQVYAVSNKFAS